MFQNTTVQSDCTFTTTQTLYSQYRTEYLSKLSIWEQLQPLVVATDAAENPFKNHEGLTTLKSTRNTEVVFVNTAKQQPKSSKQDVDGFYLGKEHQEITKSTVVTKYEFTKKKLNVNVSVDGKATDYKLNYNANVNVIDANQALLYVRSLEKTTTSFQDSPQVKVFDPFSHTLLNGSFSFTYGANTLLDYSGAENAICATLNSVAFVVDGSVYLMQINLPDNVKDKDNKMLDVIKTASTSYAKYTTVRFRSGALSYELAEYDELKCGDEVVGAQIIEAIKK